MAFLFKVLIFMPHFYWILFKCDADIFKVRKIYRRTKAHFLVPYFYGHRSMNYVLIIVVLSVHRQPSSGQDVCGASPPVSTPSSHSPSPAEEGSRCGACHHRPSSYLPPPLPSSTAREGAYSTPTCLWSAATSTATPSIDLATSHKLSKYIACVAVHGCGKLVFETTPACHPPPPRMCQGQCTRTPSAVSRL